MAIPSSKFQVPSHEGNKDSQLLILLLALPFYLILVTGECFSASCVYINI